MGITNSRTTQILDIDSCILQTACDHNSPAANFINGTAFGKPAALLTRTGRSDYPSEQFYDRECMRIVSNSLLFRLLSPVSEQ